MRGSRPDHGLFPYGKYRAIVSRRHRPATLADDSWLFDSMQTKQLWDRIEHTQADKVRQAVDELPPRHKAVVELRTWGRYTFQEIADVLGMPGRNYAHMYYKRALVRLRRSLVEMEVDYDEDS